MRMLSSSCAWLAAILLLAPAPAPGQGWTGASSKDRYGSTAATPAAGDARFSPGAAPRQSPPTPAPLRTQSAAAPITPQPAAQQPAPQQLAPRQLARAAADLAPIADRTPSRVQVTKGAGTLPNDHGQVWREYDIRPYTLRNQHEERPEQRVVDWVLRETGYEAWHSEPFGILSANRETLRVYHTEQMQGLVTDILDRFVNAQAVSKAFSLRIATVRNPNWRAKALSLMTPIPVQSPGMQGWIMPKENAAILLSQLTRRSDWREHSASNQVVLNGQSALLSTMRPRNYIKGVIRTDNTWPGFQPETGALEEGATLEFSPLLSLDQATADAVIKIRIHQVEKMAKVKLDVPTAVTGNQRMEVEVPQMTMANVHERFRWPADHVLLLSMGVVPPPTRESGNALARVIPGVAGPPRADGLLMIEVRGTAIPSASPGGAASVSTALQSGAFTGRY